MKFLSQVILNNAINYSQDRDARGWTFGYYNNDAGFRLRYICDLLPDMLPRVEYRTSAASKDTWDYYQKNVGQAIEALDRKLKAKRATVR